MLSEEIKSVLVYFRGEVSVLIQNRKSFESVFFQRFVGFVDLEVIRSRSKIYMYHNNSGRIAVSNSCYFGRLFVRRVLRRQRRGPDRSCYLKK